MRRVEVKSRISIFHEEAWQLLELSRRPSHDRGGAMEMQTLRVVKAFAEIPKSGERASPSDISNIMSLLMKHGKKPLTEIQRDDFFLFIDSMLLSPKVYETYFRIGDVVGFSDGDILGDGRIYSFHALPAPLIDYLRNQYEYKSKDEAYDHESMEDFARRRERDSFMLIRIESGGQYKAIEIAIQHLKRNINIMRFINRGHVSLYDYSSPFEFATLDRHTASLFEGERSPFDYCYHDGENWTGAGGLDAPPTGYPLYKHDENTDFIAEINEMIKNKSPSELEKKILNVIDIMGLIEGGTPTHVKFLLCIVSLESLLLSEADRDYLGWKLAEKVSYLIGGSREWYMALHDIPLGSENEKVIDSRLNADIAKTRIAMDKQIKAFYKKRSGFAHGGLQKEKSKITSQDFLLASSIVRWTIDRLLALRKSNGIEHLAPKESETEDTKSLSHYLELLKYS